MDTGGQLLVDLELLVGLRLPEVLGFVGVFHLCMVPATHDWMFVCRHKKLVQPISKLARHYVVGMYFFQHRQKDYKWDY
jgi:hypothetical protein